MPPGQTDPSVRFFWQLRKPWELGLAEASLDRIGALSSRQTVVLSSKSPLHLLVSGL